jgi:Fe2+ or Zn2+ uptake regulation protein
MLLDDYLMHLKQKGIRLTLQRQEILRVLFEGADGTGQPLNAEEILQSVRKRCPHISQDTVYRTLATFVEAGIVIELQFLDHCRRFELVQKDDHHHHLVCLICGRTRELSYCSSEFLKQAQEQYPDFQIQDHVFTVYGLCPSCQDKNSPEGVLKADVAEGL